MTSISAISSSNYQSPLQKLQDELQAEINSGTIGTSDQDALSSALTDIDSSLQSSRASDSAGGTRPSPGDLKSKIDDLICRRSVQRQADQRPGHRTAGRLQGSVRQWPRWSGWPRRRARRPRWSATRGRCLLQRQCKQFLGRQLRRRHSAAVSPVAAGAAVGLFIDLVQRDRQLQHRQQYQLVIFSASDRLPNLTSGRDAHAKAPRHHPSQNGKG